MSVEQATRRLDHGEQPPGAWAFLADKLPVEDLTAAAIAGAVLPAVDVHMTEAGLTQPGSE